MALRISEKTLREWWLTGVPTAEMARRFGCGEDAVRDRAKAFGLAKRRHGGSKKKKAGGNPVDSAISVGKSLPEKAESFNMNGPEGASNTDPGPDHSEPSGEVRTMADTSQYTDSAQPEKPEQTVTWKPIGELARRLVEKAVQRE